MILAITENIMGSLETKLVVPRAEETIKAFIVRVALWNLHASLSGAHREAHDLAGNRKSSIPQSKSIE